MVQVKEKSAEPILINAICALAARFSDHQLLANGMKKSECGHVYARRAKAYVVDTFPCPTLAAVQACLLLAYESFGSNQDSALWMYLGCAIRMAEDLGLQKINGVKHSDHSVSLDRPSKQEEESIQHSRTDTFWAVYFLDRVISSGTGRQAALRDVDIELKFPPLITDLQDEWPNPFPALVHIVHLYGKVSDFLNSIKVVEDVTPETIAGLFAMEENLTQLYHKLDTRLTFSAINFQHYVQSRESTCFTLVS